MGIRLFSFGGMFMDSLAYKLVDRVLTIYIRQDVDHHVAASIRAQIDDEIDHAKPKTAILNFSEVDFMDSSGIGLIMGRYKHMAGLDGELKLSSVNGSCKRLLELSGILEIVDIVK